jgi:hypothetical protein
VFLHCWRAEASAGGEELDVHGLHLRRASGAQRRPRATDGLAGAPRTGGPAASALRRRYESQSGPTTPTVMSTHISRLCAAVQPCEPAFPAKRACPRPERSTQRGAAGMRTDDTRDQAVAPRDARRAAPEEATGTKVGPLDSAWSISWSGARRRGQRARARGARGRASFARALRGELCTQDRSEN